MRKQTVIDQIEITRDGTINIRLSKEVVDDDESVIQIGNHRTVLPPVADLDVQLAAVNENLTRDLKMPAIADDDQLLVRLRAVAPLVQTDAVKKAYAEKLAAAAVVVAKP